LSHGRRGFTILESVIASFLLVTAIALAVLLVDSTLQAQAQNERRLAAVRAAENALEEIRAEAALGYSSMESRLNGGTWTSSDSSVDLFTHVTKQPVVVPNDSLESDYPVTASLPDVGKKILQNSILKLEVEARYGQAEGDRVSLIGYIVDSRPNDYYVSILPRSGGVIAAPYNTLDFEALAVDASGQRIEDLLFSWYVEPVDSFGTIHQVSRDGMTCVYKNTYEDYNGQFVSTPGKCILVVRAVYKGREKTYGTLITNN
jgi:type II secretory pathway pseudopilin PulG